MKTSFTLDLQLKKETESKDKIISDQIQQYAELQQKSQTKIDELVQKDKIIGEEYDFLRIEFLNNQLIEAQRKHISGLQKARKRELADFRRQILKLQKSSGNKELPNDKFKQAGDSAVSLD